MTDYRVHNSKVVGSNPPPLPINTSGYSMSCIPYFFIRIVSGQLQDTQWNTYSFSNSLLLDFREIFQFLSANQCTILNVI